MAERGTNGRVCALKWVAKAEAVLKREGEGRLGEKASAAEQRRRQNERGRGETGVKETNQWKRKGVATYVRTDLKTGGDGVLYGALEAGGVRKWPRLQKERCGKRRCPGGGKRPA